jgi:hypothetical protein
MHKALRYNSSNSTCSICCGFAVQQVIQQIHNFSTNPQFFDKSYSLSYNKSTTNPQHIEQVEFELIARRRRENSAAQKQLIAQRCFRRGPL